jgi:hypothetical protein
VLVISAAALAGCAELPCDDDISSTAPINSRSRAQIPLPDHALLTAQPEPDCEGKPVPADATKNGEPTNANADLALRIKLEYERECYRKAEMRVRDRFKRLRAATSETVSAVRRIEQGDR